MKKRSIVVMLLLALVLALALGGTALAGKVKIPPSINESATTFTYVSTDAWGISAYNYTLTFNGSPIYYRVSYVDTSGNQHWFSLNKLSHKQKVAGVVSASVFVTDQIYSATFELLDRKLNILDSYTINLQ